MKIIGIIITAVCLTLLSPLGLAAAESKIGYVNVTELYSKSAFVEKANKDLQSKVKKMEDQLQAQRKKIQDLVTSYEKTPAGSKKEALAQKITSGQTELTNMTQKFQKDIQTEQAAGMQNFTQIVQQAVQKIAKEQQVTTVLNSNAIIYTDESWIDLTKATAAAMKN